ncbi:heparan-alpha-glucosaminide N-acetyltransferase [Antarcticirhabdus aurantiaca]|uniref:Heparan-alpha-glucosaminide N-acetyltransferase n=1 Tax=Antarcticirhabdus aurantiaca TaxID=2606717 RepID=A0ACD4NWQ3_9HYPH|nr:heparan-alpha-glucosaminide N-acetyltransferase [Antarcticirhabdus aurantiaca]WAJ31266.1 heparan-alpha-glucosaminide N-acetyltransferase [Jeongeuplla avenae]
MTTSRLVSVDALRGLAILGVVAYHLVWNLAFFGLVPEEWAIGTSVIVVARLGAGLFLFLVGVGLVLAHGERVRPKAFAIRLVAIIAAAVSISVVTYVLFPDRFIYFGILHCIAAASLVGIVFVRLPSGAALLGSLVLGVTPFLVSTEAFDTRTLAWTGFAETAPSSHDFFPLLPWAGVTLAGVGIASSLRGRSARARSAKPPGPTIRALAWAGRRTLAIYLLHQPILFGAVAAAARLAR